MQAETILPSGDITASISGWENSKDSGSLINSFGLVTDSQKGLVIQIDYDLADGNWINFQSPSFGITLDFASLGDYLQFDYQGDGLLNYMKVELKDNNGQVYKSVTVSTRTADWTRVKLPPEVFSYSYGGNSLNPFAWSQIKEMGFTLNPVLGGAGSVKIDQVMLARQVDAEAAEILVNECESVTMNALGCNIGLTNDAQLNTVTSVAPVSGSYCYALTNPGTQTDRGMYEFLYYNNNPAYPVSVTPYSHLAFYLQTLSQINGDIQAELNDTDFKQLRVNIKNYGTLPIGEWKAFYIPVSVFESSLNLQSVNKLAFLLPAENVTIYLDHITFQNLTFSTQPDYLLDSMDTYYPSSSWQIAAAAGTSLLATTVEGREGQALRLQYNFTTNPKSDMWVKAYRGFGLNVLEDNSNAFRFDYLGTGRSNNYNNIEFKVLDDNDTIFVFKVEDMSNSNGKWKTITVPYDELAYFSGNDTKLNLKAITRFGFAIAKGDGGQGIFQIHDIRYLKKDDFTYISPSNRIIQQFIIDNNPFAPQSDSALKAANFSFILSETAQVSLTIYDLAGNVIVKRERGQLYPDVSYTLTWDGTDQDGKLVRNGLYLYIFSAEGEQRTQKIKNIIGVVR